MTAFVPRKIRSITKQLLKLENNRPYYLRLVGPMFLGKKIDDQKEPATLIDVVNLETGEENQIIVAAVLKGILHETYEGDSYVGKCFEVVKHRIAEAKYNTFNLSEIADPNEDAEEVEAAGAGKGGKKGGK